MRDYMKKGTGKKRYLRTMGILMASVMVLSAGTGQLVLAGDDKESTEITEEKEEKMVVYLNGKSGKDSRSGESKEKAVKTFERAAELAGDYGVIRICGTVTVKGDKTWELPSGVSVRRAKGFEDALVKVTGSLILDNVRIYADDITGDGEVEGAVEREKVYVPKSMEVEEPTVLSEIPLTKCEGDGVFAWDDEELTLSEYETECKVVFHPYDTDAVDYSEEGGWDEEEEVVIRDITVYVTSLKPEEEDGDNAEEGDVTEPESTPEATPEPTPESTPEATPEPTPESTPEATPEPTPVTPATPNNPVPSVPAEEGNSTAGDTGNGNPTVPEQIQQGDTPIVPETAPGVSDTPSAGENPASQEPSQGELTQEEQEEAVEVENLIDYLPAEVDSREVVEAIVEATKWYDALSTEQKAMFGEDTLEKLTEAQEKATVFNRQCNGVTIEGDFPWYVEFQVELKNDKNDVSVLQEKNVDTFISPYDMKLWDLMNDEEYKLNGQQVRITVPAPDEELYTQLVVVHYLEDGTVEYITPIYNYDGTISFMTSSFSPYNLAGSKVLVGNTDKVYNNSSSSGKLAGNVSGSSSGSKTSTTTSGKTTVSKTTGKTTSTPSVVTWIPKTGDSQKILEYVLIGGIALVVLIVIGVIAFKKKK